MKNSVLGLFVCVAFSLAGCQKGVDPLEEHTQDVQQAKKWLPGRWKLIEVSVQTSTNPGVPNVNLVIDENQIRLIQNGRQTDEVDYEIVSVSNGLKINTNAQPRSDNWYIRNPSLYINKKRMFFDLGRAMDGPGFEFVKVN